MSTSDPRLPRLIDASANRCREGLRVCEDVARFVLDDAALTEAFKQLRHDVTGALKPMLADALAWRDTPGDVGTAIDTAAERERADLAEICTAAAKRVGEALRSLEEACKAVDPRVASVIEQARYRHYALEQRLIMALTPARFLADARLCVLITESYCGGRDWLGVLDATLAGGADVIQLREKDLDSRTLAERARQASRRCRAANIPLVINDRPDIALLSGASGVHVGQDDLPATEVRKLVGTAIAVGVSCQSIDHATRALADRADYLGAGPVFVSKTKRRAEVPGPAFAGAVTRLTDRPVFAIAGIDASNVDDVLRAGASRIAVTRAVTEAADPAEACRRLKAKLPPAAATGR